MDLKALMQKLETIDKKQNLMEAEKKETTWTDKSGKKHPATQVKGDKYTGKEAEKDDKKKADEGIVFNSSIANALLREFGLEEAPVANPYKGADAEKFAAMSPEDQAWLTKGGGVPDINDQYILMRAPNKGKAVAKPAAPAGGQGASPAAPGAAPSQSVNPDSQQGQMMAAQTAGMNDPASGVAGVTGGSQQDNMLAAQTAGMNDPAGGQAASPAKPADGSFDSFGNPVAAGSAAATSADPTGLAQAQQDVDAAGAKPTAPAGGQAASPAKPAAPAANKSMTPAITAYASRMGLLKNNKPDVEAIKKFQQANGLKADGIIGPNTAGAILSSQKPGAAMGGGGGGPAPAGGQAASPAKPAAAPAAGSDKIRAEIDRFKSKNNMSLQANREYVARLQAKLDAAGGQAASPAAPAAPAPTTSGGRSYTPPKQEESIVTQDDAILARIKSALRF